MYPPAQAVVNGPLMSQSPYLWNRPQFQSCVMHELLILLDLCSEKFRGVAKICFHAGERERREAMLLPELPNQRKMETPEIGARPVWSTVGTYQVGTAISERESNLLR